MRKTNLPKQIHFGELRRESGVSSSQKSLSVWGFINTTDVECSCLKDPDYGTDLMSSNTSSHKNLAVNMSADSLDRECGVKFKGKVHGITCSSKVRRCVEHLVLPTSIRTGFASVPMSSLLNEEYDPKQGKLKFPGGAPCKSDPAAGTRNDQPQSSESTGGASEPVSEPKDVDVDTAEINKVEPAAKAACATPIVQESSVNCE